MIKFGTGGWRAIIGDEFTRQNINLLCQSLSNLMSSEGADKIVIGFDRRFLSDKGAKWAAEVFAANNIKVLMIPKNAPTPLIMYAVNKFGCKYGMAITASHNPADYNGIKVFTEGGRDATQEITSKIEKIATQSPVIKQIDYYDGKKSGIIEDIYPFNDYIDGILDMIDTEAIRNSRLKVLLDPMYGVSKTSLQTILLTTRCEVDIINDRHDTLFGGKLPSPSAATLSKLREMVVLEGYDIGIATDGDADRIGIIDNEGLFIHPNEIMMLLYYYLIKYKGWKGDVVRNIATTHILDKIAEDNGFICHEVPVGFKHISSKMEETDALVGGESSGGLTIRGHIKGKDGIFAASLLVEMVCVTGKGLSEMLNEIYTKYGYMTMSEADYSFSLQKKSELMDILFNKKQLPDFGHEIDRVSYLDGAKVYFKNGGWIIARFSGTEPLLRIFCEMQDIETARDCTDKLRKFLNL